MYDLYAEEKRMQEEQEAMGRWADRAWMELEPKFTFGGTKNRVRAAWQFILRTFL